jgi:ABC-type Fe3+-hydroxamate transport system substrate-binding protein
LFWATPLILLYSIMYITSPFQLSKKPQRIISLVPSQTELLYDLGLNDEVIGITKFCIHPEAWFRSKKRIGGTKNIHVEEIISLQPDLILANKEENVKDQVDELALHFPVYVSDVSNYEEALEMIAAVGELTHAIEKATNLISEIKAAFDRLAAQNYPKLRTAYLIWKDPYMTIGSDTFIHDLMEKTGLVNIYADEKRYPQITASVLSARKPELVLLSSEPYPFKQKHMEELQVYLPEAKIILADGEMFSWYGSRMLKAPSCFQKLREEISNTLI